MLITSKCAPKHNGQDYGIIFGKMHCSFCLRQVINTVNIPRHRTALLSMTRNHHFEAIH